jgi:hypothetical protein
MAKKDFEYDYSRAPSIRELGSGIGMTDETCNRGWL